MKIVIAENKNRTANRPETVAAEGAHPESMADQASQEEGFLGATGSSKPKTSSRSRTRLRTRLITGRGLGMKSVTSRLFLGGETGRGAGGATGSGSAGALSSIRTGTGGASSSFGRGLEATGAARRIRIGWAAEGAEAGKAA